MDYPDAYLCCDEGSAHFGRIAVMYDKYLDVDGQLCYGPTQVQWTSQSFLSFLKLQAYDPRECGVRDGVGSARGALV
mgnify:CR=1 FL=1